MAHTYAVRYDGVRRWEHQKSLILSRSNATTVPHSTVVCTRVRVLFYTCAMCALYADATRGSAVTIDQQYIDTCHVCALKFACCMRHTAQTPQASDAPLERLGQCLRQEDRHPNRRCYSHQITLHAARAKCPAFCAQQPADRLPKRLLPRGTGDRAQEGE